MSASPPAEWPIASSGPRSSALLTPSTTREKYSGPPYGCDSGAGLSPKPGRSIAMIRRRDANAGMTRRHAFDDWPRPWRTSSVGPEPASRYRARVPATSTDPTDGLNACMKRLILDAARDSRLRLAGADVDDAAVARGRDLGAAAGEAHRHGMLRVESDARQASEAIDHRTSRAL